MTQEQLDALLVNALEEEMDEAAARQEASLQHQQSESKTRIAERLRSTIRVIITIYANKFKC